MAGGEADQQEGGVLGGGGRVKVVTGRVGALVQLLVDRLADVRRLYVDELDRAIEVCGEFLLSCYYFVIRYIENIILLS